MSYVEKQRWKAIVAYVQLQQRMHASFPQLYTRATNLTISARSALSLPHLCRTNVCSKDYCLSSHSKRRCS